MRSWIQWSWKEIRWSGSTGWSTPHLIFIWASFPWSGGCQRFLFFSLTVKDIIQHSYGLNLIESKFKLTLSVYPSMVFSSAASLKKNQYCIGWITSWSFLPALHNMINTMAPFYCNYCIKQDTPTILRRKNNENIRDKQSISSQSGAHKVLRTTTKISLCRNKLERATTWD